MRQPSRYSNFEALHKRLYRSDPFYRNLGLRLPAKRIFSHSYDPRFINKRRIELDTYLGAIIKVEDLAKNNDMWQFLSYRSDIYRCA